LFITCQRFIAVTFPLHAKLILRNKVFWVSTITLCFTSFFFMVLRLMFERANYLKLIIFKMFYNYDEDFLIIATFIRNTLPIFGIFIFSKLISVILKLKSINSSTNQENNKKVTKIIICLGLVFSVCEVPSFIVSIMMKPNNYDISNIFLILHSNTNFVIFMSTSSTFQEFHFQRNANYASIRNPSATSTYSNNTQQSGYKKILLLYFKVHIVV
jgi:hypothetical protein